MPEETSYAVVVGDWPDATFRVVRFVGEEGVSQLYWFRIDVAAEDADIAFDELLGEQATLRLRQGAQERLIQGVIADVEVLDQVGDYTVYRLLLKPAVWELGLGAVNKAYLDATTPEIITEVLERAGITEVDHVQDLETNDYRPWSFRLQYNESHWHFLSRVLEREGIYYYFTAGEDCEQIVFCDARHRQPEIADPRIPYEAALGASVGDSEGAVHALVARQRRLPRELIVQSYNDVNPSTEISASAIVDDAGLDTVTEYGQNIGEVEEAEALARIRAEEIRATKAIYNGESTVVRLVPGHEFELHSHFRTRNNGRYLITALEHNGYDPHWAGRVKMEPEGDAPVYENRFTAIPAYSQYRPPRATPVPEIKGSITAHIDAESDSGYAELDEEGRYRVVFPFQQFRPTGNGGSHAEPTRPGKASHWVRMIQPYGGTREGMHFPLRKGTRVLIDFLAGDPDQPVIAGTLPTTEQASVTQSDNLAHGTLRTASGNLIEVDDETPRIKLYSPHCDSYFHLGYSNAPGDGIVSATTGISLTASLGGTGGLSATDGWMIDSEIWPESTFEARNREIAAGALPYAAAKGEGEEWKIQDTIGRYFRFPLKHERPDSDDVHYRSYHERVAGADSDEVDEEEYVTSTDELSHLLHVSRSVGDAYHYSSGTSFAFNGPQNEAFRFGPTASLASHSHYAKCADLRQGLRTVIDEFVDAEPGYGNSGSGDVDDVYTARKKRLRREALLVWNEDAKFARTEQDGAWRPVDDAHSGSFVEVSGNWRPFDSDEAEQADDDAVLIKSEQGGAWKKRDEYEDVKEEKEDGKTVWKGKRRDVDEKDSQWERIGTEDDFEDVKTGDDATFYRVDGVWKHENEIESGQTRWKVDGKWHKKEDLPDTFSGCLKEWVVNQEEDGVALGMLRGQIDRRVERILGYVKDEAGDKEVVDFLRTKVEEDLEEEIEEDEQKSNLITDRILSLLYPSGIAREIHEIFREGSDEVKGGWDFDEEDVEQIFEGWFEEEIATDSQLNLEEEETELGDPASDSNKTEYLVHLIAEHVRSMIGSRDVGEKVALDRLLRGSLSIADHSSVSVTHGDSISFRKGASYSEVHVAPVDDEIPSDLVDFAGKDHDKTSDAGPNWGTISASVNAYDPGADDFGGDWEPGNVDVSKTIGNTYSYHKGSSMSVRYGNAHSVVRVEDYDRTEHLDPRGNMIAFSQEGWNADGSADGGWNAFAVNYMPAIGMTMNLGTRSNITVNAGIINETAINMLGKNELAVNFGGVGRASIDFGFVGDLNISGLGAGIVNLTGGGRKTISSTAGYDVAVGNNSFKANIEATPLSTLQRGTDIVNQTYEMRAQMGHLQKDVTALAQHSTDIALSNFSIKTQTMVAIG